MNESRDQNGRTLVERFPQIAAVGVGIVLIVFGLWAFFAPRSFFDAVAVFQPYNEHFVHDIGAFQIGLGAVLVLGAYLADALFVALAGVGMGATLHLISHVIDRDLGGNPSSDIPLLAVMTGALVAGAIVRGKGARP